MMESFKLQFRTVAEWKSRGFMFREAPALIGCTEVTYDGRPFVFFRESDYESPVDLTHWMHHKMEHASDGKLVVSGTYSDDRTFPVFLATEKARDLMAAAWKRRRAAMDAAQQAQCEFIAALHDKEHFDNNSTTVG